VRLDPAPVQSTPFERQIFGEDIDAGWRLACRTLVAGPTQVVIPPGSQMEEQIIQIDGESRHPVPDLAARLFPITLQPPSLRDQTADFERVSHAIADRYGVALSHAGLPALIQLSQMLRQGGWQVTLAIDAGELIATFPGAPPRALGFAVDVGTTKLACYLVDLSNGQVIAARGVMNPQISFGEDIMSRLEAVLSDPENARRQQFEVVKALNEVALDLCAQVGEPPARLIDACLVGNTAMHHLLLGLPIRSLAACPFVPVVGQAVEIAAAEIGLTAAPGTRLHFPAPIAGFVGSDHLAFLLAQRFGEDERIRLGIDIGTNTEIALQAHGRIVSCSTASGPTFEGAHITYGMRAAPGAIERVQIDAQGGSACEVIGGGRPSGICGSGILDSLAELFRNGVINSRGRLQTQLPCVQTDPQGILFYHLTGGTNGSREIAITQGDIDQLLLAKGAMRAGIEILMHALGVTPGQIDEVVLAGAFGSYLDPCNAIRIGLLPELPLSRIHAVGNAAGAGARWMLISKAARTRAAQLARHVEYLELTVYPGFSKYFAKGACLPLKSNDQSQPEPNCTQEESHV
jgi:uncharacterized 2Fe-2S/4Fe-4S cluster protein (DUF4445 family)